MQILGHSCELPLVASCQLRFLISYVISELFVSNYLSGVPVN